MKADTFPIYNDRPRRTEKRNEDSDLRRTCAGQPRIEKADFSLSSNDVNWREMLLRQSGMPFDWKI